MGERQALEELNLYQSSQWRIHYDILLNSYSGKRKREQKHRNFRGFQKKSEWKGGWLHQNKMMLIFKDFNNSLEISNWLSKVCSEMEEMTDALSWQGKSYQLLILCAHTTQLVGILLWVVWNITLVVPPMSLLQTRTEVLNCCSSETLKIPIKQESTYAVLTQ